jgi:hypothetical protein
MELHLHRELLGPSIGDVDADLAHGLDHLRPDLGRWLLPRRLCPDVSRGVALEQGLGHLRATGVVGADEQDVLHALFLRGTASGAMLSIDSHQFNRYMHIDGRRSGTLAEAKAPAG